MNPPKFIKKTLGVDDFENPTDLLRIRTALYDVKVDLTRFQTVLNIPKSTIGTLSVERNPFEALQQIPNQLPAPEKGKETNRHANTALKEQLDEQSHLINFTVPITDNCFLKLADPTIFKKQKSEEPSEGRLSTASSDSAILASSHKNPKDPSNKVAHLVGAAFSSTTDVNPKQSQIKQRKEEKNFPKNSVETVH